MAINKRYISVSEVPDRLRLFPLPGALLLPGMEIPLNIFEPRYLAMIDDALASDRLVAMIQSIPESFGTPNEPALANVGCVGRITQIAETGDGRYTLVLSGIIRFRVLEELAGGVPYRRCLADFRGFEQDLVADLSGSDEDRAALIVTFRDFARDTGLKLDWTAIEHLPTDILVNSLALIAPLPPTEKQALLEAPDIAARARILIALAGLAAPSGGRDSSKLH